MAIPVAKDFESAFEGSSDRRWFTICPLAFQPGNMEDFPVHGRLGLPVLAHSYPEIRDRPTTD